MNGITLPMALFLAVAASGMWAFIAVASWGDNRRKEREAYYRHETIKKIAEMPGDAGLALLREDERMAARRRQENIKLGGLVTSAVGVALMVFLRGIEKSEPVYLVGLIPLLVGLGLFASHYILAAKE
jgi:ferric-dicitrate binding protein FerR (iron transport regulator)